MDENGMNKIKTIALLSSIGALTVILGGVALIVTVLFVLGLFDTEGVGSGGHAYSYESECNYEETKVTIMDGNNKEILATQSLEDYVIGVACPEVGLCDGYLKSANPEYVKANYVAIKTFVLATGRYNSNTKTIVIRASTRDQQWCHIDKGCYVTETDEYVGAGWYYMNTYPGDYDKSKADGTVTQERRFTEEDIELARKYYAETYGDLILSTSYNDKINSLGDNDYVGYKSKTQDYWETAAASGKNYAEILKSTATADVPNSENYINKEIYKLASYCKATRRGTNGNLVSLEEYPDVTSTTKIDKPINTLLSESEINTLNSYIEESVNTAGYGTGEAVAAAAQSLIYGLYQYNYHLPYWYGGGHNKGINLGIDKNWGKKGTTFDPTWSSSNIGKGRNIYSYDCSGFVSWSIKNACKSNFWAVDSSTFNGYGKGISLKDAKPGDLMVDPGSHVRLIVKNNGENGVIAAESTASKTGGVMFINYQSAGSYKIVDMQDWYNNNCSIST